MDDGTTELPISPTDVADILDNIANLMASFHSSDVALQNALSGLTKGMEGPTAMHELQHIDLLTQVHADLAKMLPVVAGSLRSTPTNKRNLLAALTLRSLQETLVEPESAGEKPAAGELSLF